MLAYRFTLRIMNTQVDGKVQVNRREQHPVSAVHLWALDEVPFVPVLTYFKLITIYTTVSCFWKLSVMSKPILRANMKHIHHTSLYSYGHTTQI